MSELIRRIALSRYSRKACAGLEGEAWLSWLAEHDPKQFNWLEEAPWLITLPYAPPGSSVPKAEIERAIQAMKRWVR